MKTTLYFFLSGLFSLISFIAIGQETHHVPADFASIQMAMQNAVTGDTVVVAQGTYYENIEFYGKDIYLTSEFLYTQDNAIIENTIIDGSQAIDADNASVIRVMEGETNNAVIRGFTITGGTGTEIYSLSDVILYRGGGGINVDHSSPTIINNIIRNNSCTPTPNFDAGGGGLHIVFGTPYIANNIITENSGAYAGGIMLAYCGGTCLENNLISYNHSDGDFGGGGGISVEWESINIVNNTIVNNDSDGTGGGLCITGNTSTIKNCIIYGNTVSGDPTTASIRKRFDGNPTVTYTDIAGAWGGVGNIDIDPMYLDEVGFELNELSSCVDAGDPAIEFNDEIDAETGAVLPPAQGGVQNDMGASGGQHFCGIPPPLPIVGIQEVLNPTFDLFMKGGFVFIKQNKRGYLYLNVFNSLGQLMEVLYEGVLEEGIHQFKLSNTGFLFIQAQDKMGISQTVKSFRKTQK